MPHNKTNAKITSADFLGLQSNTQSGSRIAIAEKISHHIDQAPPESSEHLLACEIAFFLQKDESKTVRAALASGIATSTKTPKNLALLLAHDSEDEVATPILRYSPILQEIDLNALIAEINDSVKLVAVAERNFLSVTMSRCLIAKKFENVCSSLLQNPKADLDTNCFREIAQNHKHNEEVIKNLQSRIPTPMAEIDEILNKKDTEQVNTLITKIQSFSPISDIKMHADVSALLQLGETPSYADAKFLLKKLQAKKPISANILFSALCLGQERFFIAAIASHASLPTSEVEKMCHDPEGRFKVLFAKSRMSSSLEGLMVWMLKAMLAQKKRGYPVNSYDFSKAMSRQMREAETRGINFAKTVGISIAKIVEHNLRK